MLTIPKSASTIASLIGIDPGSQALGCAILRFDLVTMQIVGCEATTFIGKDYIKNSWNADMHGDLVARINEIRWRLLNLFNEVRPYMIASEVPFYNSRFPGAYGPLVQVVAAIRSAVIEHDRWKQLYMLEPSLVKKGVGAATKSNNKDEILEAILRLPDFVYDGRIPLTSLDNNGVDAVAVAYSQFQLIKRSLCLI